MKKTVFGSLLLACLASMAFGQSNFYDVNPTEGNGVRFWASDYYKIHMGNSYEYHFGPVTDYSIKMNMSSNGGRGWTWGVAGQAPIAALNNIGDMKIAGVLNAGKLDIAGDNADLSILKLRNVAWDCNQRTALEFWNGGLKNFPTSRIVSQMDGCGAQGEALLFETQTAGATSPSVKLTIKNDGNVGIGTSSPADQLEIVSGNRKVGLNAAIPGVTNGGAIAISRGDDGMKTLYIGSSAAPADDNVIFSQGGGTELRLVSFGGPYATSGFGFYVNNTIQDAFASAKPTPVMKIDGNGLVGIGTATPDSKLTVKGDIHTREVKVDLEGAVGPDYVFEPDYDLVPLSELETYIKANKHLPEVPSAKEMEANGLNLKEMNLLLLKKVEELTLHILNQQKQIDNQQSQITELQNKTK